MIELLVGGLIAALPAALPLENSFSSTQSVQEISSMLLSASNVPASPSNLSITGVTKNPATGNYLVSFKWNDNSTNEDNFKLFLSYNSTSNFSAVKILGANSTSFTLDMGPNPSPATYYFNVRASNSSGSSVPSNMVSTPLPSITSPVATVPSAPSNMTLANVTKDSVTGNYLVNFKWNDNSTNEDNFKLFLSYNSTSNFSAIKTLGANSTSFTLDMGPNPSPATYYYNVKASNSSGSSASSNMVSTPLPINIVTVPATPSNMAVASVTKGATSGNYYVNLTWKDNSANETGFKLYQAVNSQSNFSLIKTTAQNAISYGVNIGTNPVSGTYYYRATAMNSSGESQPSNVASAQIAPTPPPTVTIPVSPSNLTSSISKDAATGNYKVTLNWSDNSNNETGFEVSQSINSTSNFQTAKSVAAGATSVVCDLGASPTFGTYNYQVVAVNSAGKSQPSNTSSFQIQAPVTPPPTTFPTYQPPAGYQKAYTTNFDAPVALNYGSFDGWSVQANTGDITFVAAPGGKGGYAIKATANKDEAFSGVANGTPRAEIARTDQLLQGRDYMIHWRIYLPADYQFDKAGFNNQESLAQIHQDLNTGSPPFLLGLDGSSYYMFSEAGNSQYKTVLFGNAAADRGKWVDWVLHYVPSSGSNGLSELYKDGQLVQRFTGPNAFPNGSKGYFKMGIYKWFWKTQPSDVTTRTRYYDDFDVYQK